MTAPVLETPPDIQGFSIFCDDIRSEIDGKQTLVGSYLGREMMVRSAFPVTLPKFCISMHFIQRIEIFTPELGIRVFLPGDSDDNASIQGEFTAEVPHGAGPMISLVTNVVFAPLVLTEPGEIKVRILRAGVLHRLGTLKVLQDPDFTKQQQAQTTSDAS